MVIGTIIVRRMRTSERTYEASHTHGMACGPCMRTFVDVAGRRLVPWRGSSISQISTGSRRRRDSCQGRSPAALELLLLPPQCGDSTGSPHWEEKTMAGQSAAATAAASRRRTSSATSAATRRAGSRSSSRTRRRGRRRLPLAVVVVVALAPHHLPAALHALLRSRSGRLALTLAPVDGDEPPSSPPRSRWYRHAERGSRRSLAVSTSRRPM